MVTTVMMTNGDDSWTYPPMSNLASWDIVRWENHCTLMTPWRVDLGNHIWEPLVPYNEDLFLRQVIDRCGYGTHIQLLWLYIYMLYVVYVVSTGFYLHLLGQSPPFQFTLWGVSRLVPLKWDGQDQKTFAPSFGDLTAPPKIQLTSEHWKLQSEARDMQRLSVMYIYMYVYIYALSLSQNPTPVWA